MARLGETTAALARLRRSLNETQVSDGDGGMSEVAWFGPNPGRLRMLAYLPEGLPRGAPLVVVLHGCTQRAGAYAAAAGWLALADRYGFAVVAPEQSPANNPNRCFNWYEPGHAHRDAGEPASVRAMVDEMVGAYDLDPSRIFISGLSAGGAMAAVMLAAYPDVFAGGAVIAGLPYGAADNLLEALSAMRGARGLSGDELTERVLDETRAADRLPRLSIWHGDADATVHHSNGLEAARQWATAHGLADQPDDIQALPGRTRSQWRSARGEVVVELNQLAGFGHGTPLASNGKEGVGRAAPYMLEAGISSTLETARFWGLAPAAEVSSAAAAAVIDRRVTAEAEQRPAGVAATVMAAVAPHVSSSVQRIIAGALKTAGLNR